MQKVMFVIKEQNNREIKLKTIAHRENEQLPEPFLHGNLVELGFPELKFS